MKNHKTIILGGATGCVGNGPFSVWIDQDNVMIPEAFGFTTSDEAFAHVDKLGRDQKSKLEALLTLAGDDLPPMIKDELANVKQPEYRVYRMEPVSRVDVSQLPRLS